MYYPLEILGPDKETPSNNYLHLRLANRTFTLAYLAILDREDDMPLLTLTIRF
jgi:hypothetical protein